MHKFLSIALVTALVAAAIYLCFSCDIVGDGDETVYITKTGTKYHRAGCRYLSKSAIQIEKDEAIRQGYTACSVCKP